jgi:hypothetical protein
MAPAFSKPIVNARPAGSRKRTISAALSSSDNVDPTAIKKRKLAVAAAAANTEAQRLKALNAERRASVESEDNVNDRVSHVGRHAPEGVVLQLDTDDDDDPAPPLEDADEDDDDEEDDDEEVEETEEDEISKALLINW